MERADVCLILIDATQGVTEQDEKIAGIAHEAGKASVIVVNKWDLVEKDNSSVKRFTDDIRTALAYMPYAPILFISAKTGQRVPRLFEQIRYVNEQASLRISTGMLNDVLSDAVTRVQPPDRQGKKAENLLYDRIGRKTADFCYLLQRCGAFPFFLSAVFGKQAA